MDFFFKSEFVSFESIDDFYAVMRYYFIFGKEVATLAARFLNFLQSSSRLLVLFPVGFSIVSCIDIRGSVAFILGNRPFQRFLLALVNRHDSV